MQAVVTSAFVVLAAVGIAVGAGAAMSIVVWAIAPTTVVDPEAPTNALLVSLAGLVLASLSGAAASLTARRT
jgi:hypothetical protein